MEVWRLKNYTAATIMKNTMVTVHKSYKTCSVHVFLQKKKKKKKKNNKEIRPYVK